MDTKALELRPDWTQPQYPTGHKIDLSNNVCFDAALPTFEFDLNRYSDTSKCYKILSDRYDLYSRQIAIGLGLSELIMRIMFLIKHKGLTFTSMHTSWAPIDMCRKLYQIPIGQDVCYISNPHGTAGTIIENYDELIDKHKLLIIDEAYADFCEEMPKAKYGSPNVLVLKTLSKSLALPGARFGYAFGHEVLINEIQNLRPAQIALPGIDDNLISILDEIPNHVKRMNATKAYIEKNYECIPSHGNYVLIKNYEKFNRHFHVKELEGHCRMALINRNMVTKNAINKEHPFFD